MVVVHRRQVIADERRVPEGDRGVDGATRRLRRTVPSQERNRQDRVGVHVGPLDHDRVVDDSGRTCSQICRQRSGEQLALLGHRMHRVCVVGVIAEPIKSTLFVFLLTTGGNT